MDIMVTMAITAVMATLVGKDILVSMTLIAGMATISPAALGTVLSVDSNDPHCSNI